MFYFVDVFHVPSVYLTGSVPRWRTENSTWPVRCLSDFLTLSLSLILCRLLTIFNVILDHMYKGSSVTSVCIGKRKILLLRPTQRKLFISSTILYDNSVSSLPPSFRISLIEIG